MTNRGQDPGGPEIEGGSAVVPDAEDAPTSDDLAAEEPPAEAPATGDPAKKSAVPPPVPAHGESASREQIEEATRAEERDNPDGAAI